MLEEVGVEYGLVAYALAVGDHAVGEFGDAEIESVDDVLSGAVRVGDEIDAGMVAA